MNLFKKAKYQLYLFQLENYNVGRYLKIAYRATGFKNEQRQDLVWTNKLKAVAGVSLVLFFATVFAFVLYLHRAFSITGLSVPSIPLFYLIILLLQITLILFFAYVVISLAPLYFAVSKIILLPLDFYLKSRIIQAAKDKIKIFNKLKIIAVAGSYGKTTAKEVVSAILSKKYKVLKTPENINTPLGISELVNERLDENLEVFVVEMGEHARGDIKKICDIVKPDISMLTGINEAHLERMGSIENAIATIFELAENSKGEIILNGEDSLIVGSYGKYTKGRQVYFYGAANKLSAHEVRNLIFKSAPPLGYEFELCKSGEFLGKFKTELLGEYAIGTITAGVIVGNLLGVDYAKIAQAVAELKPVKHRLEPIYNPNGTIVIDDSYNGNPDGVDQAIRLLGKFKNRRKIYVTPGLVETGSKSEQIHLEIGKNLGRAADLVVLVKNSVTDYIVRGLKEAGFPADKIIVFESAKQAHSKMSGIVKPGDVVLFQNDWPDNYL